MQTKNAVRSQLIALCVLIFISITGFSAEGAATPDLAAGSGIFTMPEATGANASDLEVFYHRPLTWTPDRPILIVMHGAGRNASGYNKSWSAEADAQNILVVTPNMSEKKYPGERYYNIGDMLDSNDEGGHLRPEKNWVFPVIDRVFEQVRARTGATSKGFILYGHSAGAQFVHRYLLLTPETKATMIISANAGWYTMPDREASFPYGLKGIQMTDESLAKAFARPVVILLGDQDTDPNHDQLRRNAQSNKQGAHRVARGHRFYEISKAKAAELGVPVNWKIGMVPGVGHTNGGMAKGAIKLIDQ